ncbi:MAG TPA: Ig domain-containing protein, partial [bacterium]|nr:Ig domain-containing protein [bacterium]
MPWYDGNIPTKFKTALERKTGAKFAVEVVLDPDGAAIALDGDHDIVDMAEVTQERDLDIDQGGMGYIQDVVLTFNDLDNYFDPDNTTSPFHQCEGTLSEDASAGATVLKLLSWPGVAFADTESLIISDATNSETVGVGGFTADTGSEGYHTLLIDAPGLAHDYAAGSSIYTAAIVGKQIIVRLANLTETTAEKLTLFRGEIIKDPEVSCGQARITCADARKRALDSALVGADPDATNKLMCVGTDGALRSSIVWPNEFNVPPLTYVISDGALPAGLIMDSDTGAISGTPTTAGNYSFTIKVTNADGEYVTQDITLQIVGHINTEFNSAEGTTAYEQIAGDIGWNSAASLAAREGYCRFSITNKAANNFYWDNTFPQNSYNAFAIKNPDSLSGNFCIIARIESTSMPSVATLYFGIGVILGSTGLSGGYVLGYNRLSTRIGVYDAGANNNFGNATGVATTLEFRIRRVTTTYYFSYRVPGGTWTDFSTKTNANAVYKIGLLACTDETATTNILGSVDFDFLRAYYGSLAIATTTLPGSIAGDPYDFTLRATGGAGEYSWDVSVGSLPAGLSLNASTGVISGTPTANGTASFTLRVTDGAGATATASVSIVVSADYQVLPTVFPWGEVGVAYDEALRLYVGGGLDRDQVTVGSRCP